MARDTRFGQQIKTTQKKQASKQASKQAISPSFLQLFQLYRGKHTHRPRSHGQSIKIRKTTALKKKKKRQSISHPIIIQHRDYAYNKKSNNAIYIPTQTTRI